MDANDFNAYKAKLEATSAEMADKNKRIYFDSVPELTSLPKVEKLLKVSPAPIAEDISGLESGISSLDALVPREVRGMVSTYKSQMMQFVSENLDKYENEAKVNQFLADIGLPFSLETCTSTNEIPEFIWKKISEVQQNGGALYMTNQLANIERRGDDIMRRLGDLENTLKHEENEDNNYRSTNMYGQRWKRQTSSNLNQSYFTVLWEYKSKYRVNLFRKIGNCEKM